MRAVVFLFAVVLALTGCATVPGETVLVFPEGTLTVTRDRAAIREHFLLTLPEDFRPLAAASFPYDCGWWDAKSRTGWVYDSPALIEHEREHMQGIPHEAMVPAVRFAPCPSR